MTNPCSLQTVRFFVLSTYLCCASGLHAADPAGQSQIINAILSGDYYDAREKATALDYEAASPSEQLGANLAALSREQIADEDLTALEASCMRISRNAEAPITIRAAARFLLGRIAAEMGPTPQINQAEKRFESVINDFPGTLPAEHAKVEMCLLHILSTGSMQTAVTSMPYTPEDIADKDARRNLHIVLAQLSLRNENRLAALEHLGAILKLGVNNRSIRGGLLLSYANLAFETQDMATATSAYRAFLSENAGDGRTAAVKARLNQIESLHD